MATMLIAGESVHDFAQAWGVGDPAPGGLTGPTAGNYYAIGDLGSPPFEGPSMYSELEIVFPGLSGVGIKRMGWRGRLITCRLLFVDTTKALVETRKNALFALITPLASFSITVPGGTARPSCRLIAGGGNSGTWMQMGGRFVLAVDLEFKQMREV